MGQRVGGRGKTISDCGLRIADLKARKQESGEAQSKSIGKKVGGKVQLAAGSQQQAEVNDY